MHVGWSMPALVSVQTLDRLQQQTACWQRAESTFIAEPRGQEGFTLDYSSCLSNSTRSVIVQIQSVCLGFFKLPSLWRVGYPDKAPISLT